ncbi:TRAF2-like protein [Mya arenaria]|uniref:TRAF2-like protein n=1 Tax=Mya arenaria TaxID=6604 RepID=A0ABY7GC52_MYAAR|nr:TRAF2-like protein [Mya arenaria]
MGRGVSGGWARVGPGVESDPPALEPQVQSIRLLRLRFEAGRKADMSIGGYPAELFGEGLVDEKYFCIICKKVLREPTQAYCGDRDGVTAVECPRPECMDEDNPSQRTIIKDAEIFPDNAIRRELFRLHVQCINVGCEWKGKYREFETHFPVCEFRLEACSHCNQPVRVLEMQFGDHQRSHSNIQCPACPPGSNPISKEEFQAHFNDCQHSGYVFAQLQRLEQHVGSTEQDLGETKRQLTDKFTEIEANIRQVAANAPPNSGFSGSLPPDLNLDQKIRQLFEQMAVSLNERVDTKTGTFEGIANTLHRELEKSITAIEKLDRHRRLESEKAEASQQKIKSLERTIAAKDAKISELEMKLKDVEVSCYDGMFIWKVSDFSQKQQDAIQGRSISIYSNPFYTRKFGYKMCGRLYPNGDGMGKGSHMSVFFVIMRGEYDALQPWPFKHRVTFCLLNQEGGNATVDSFRPDTTSSSFKRPTTNMNIASGCPLFIRLDTLTNPTNGFLKDDTLFLKMIVDISDFKEA